MSGDSMRAKARQIFGKEFMNAVKPQAPAKNEAVALQQRANARPIPTYKDGGKIAGMPPQKRGPNGSVTVAIGVEMKPKKPGYRTMTEAEQKALDTVTAAGVKVIKPDKEPFQESVKPIWKEFIEDSTDPVEKEIGELITKIQEVK